MSDGELKDLSASVHRRLLNKSREEGRPFNELLQYYAMERFLYRLSKSPYSRKFILKGALMLTVWNVPVSRPTSDVDFLASIENNVDTVVSVVKEICTQKVESDGITLDADSVTGEVIAEVAEYQGVRVRIRGNLGPAKVNVQLDIGFGDRVVPSPVSFAYPVLLDMPVPRLRGYSRESLIAEKLESIARFGMLNSRMKDFFDIWLLSRQYDFNGEVLHTAIDVTFTNRGSKASPEFMAFLDAFSKDAVKSAQWRAFCRKNRLDFVPLELEEVVESIAKFVGPLVSAKESGKSFKGSWAAPGPWKRD